MSLTKKLLMNKAVIAALNDHEKTAIAGGVTELSVCLCMTESPACNTDFCLTASCSTACP